MNFQPLGLRVLVQRVEEQTTTVSGIIIPDSAQEKQSSGTVIAISNEVKEEGELQVGDKVVFDTYAGSQMNIDNTEYLVMNTDDILGIFKD